MIILRNDHAFMLYQEMLLKYPDCYELLVRCAEDDLPDYYHRIEPGGIAYISTFFDKRLCHNKLFLFAGLLEENTPLLMAWNMLMKTGNIVTDTIEDFTQKSAMV